MKKIKFSIIQVSKSTWKYWVMGSSFFLLSLQRLQKKNKFPCIFSFLRIPPFRIIQGKGRNPSPALGRITIKNTMIPWLAFGSSSGLNACLLTALVTSFPAAITPAFSSGWLQSWWSNCSVYGTARPLTKDQPWYRSTGDFDENRSEHCTCPGLSSVSVD